MATDPFSNASSAPRPLYILVTMDAEPPRPAVTDHARAMSASGPISRSQSERSIRGYTSTARAYGYPVTLFAHPEVAKDHAPLLKNLESDGCTVGLHLHPYKLIDRNYAYDLGYYAYHEQREILEHSVRRWADAMGRTPLCFRGGYFSANDDTFRILTSLGFTTGSVSIPCRVLPEHASVWAGACAVPHRAHAGFRHLPGDLPFVEVPVTVDTRRPTQHGAAGETGCEWLYVGTDRYDHAAVARDLVALAAKQDLGLRTILLDCHNDQEFEDLTHPASVRLAVVLDTIRESSRREGLEIRGVSLEGLVEAFYKAEGKAASIL